MDGSVLPNESCEQVNKDQMEKYMRLSCRPDARNGRNNYKLTTNPVARDEENDAYIKEMIVPAP